MAILFEQVIQIPARFWMEAQGNYDEYKARLDYQIAINEAQNWAKDFPYAQMANFGWVPKTKIIKEKYCIFSNF